MARGYVLLHASKYAVALPLHVRNVIAAVAESLAAFRGYEFAGWDRPASGFPPGHRYFVPDDTLTVAEARTLGIRSIDDFFGGVVSRSFVKTKAVTHRLIHDRATRPEGWSIAFSQKLRGVVLPGYTAFTPEDARVAAMRMLEHGPVRLKSPLGASGARQTVARDLNTVTAFLGGFPHGELADYGLVLEANLRAMTTLNIGQIRIGSSVLSYHGVQRHTVGPDGQPEYGGSDLVCVRGDWDALEALPLTPHVQAALNQIRIYDAATHEYTGFMASRRNYDVGIGIDVNGKYRSGVLEASWRVGGASTAELAALTAFARDSALRIVEVSAVSASGEGLSAPEGAVIHFQGEDPQTGPWIRYTMITRTVSECNDKGATCQAS